MNRRLADLVENETVRKIISQPETSISFPDALTDRKIILLDARSGQIGDWAAGINGSVVLTQLWSATAARSTLPPSDRTPHHITIDEVQEYVFEADHLRRMLSQCREFNVSVTAATQYLDDLDLTMERALLNNTLTKVVFTPGASHDLPTFTTLMNGLTKEDLSRLGKYRPAVQRPAERSLPRAEVIDTYPPWNVDSEAVRQRKETLLKQHEEPEARLAPPVNVGDGANAGGREHRVLLTWARDWLEERGFEVELLYQNAGSDKPDGHVTLPDGETAHLEAESGTLSKPAKILKNLHRATLRDRETIFAVAEGDAERLESILFGPVNRDESTEEFSYYQLDGEPFDAVNKIRDAKYRIIEIDLANTHETPDGDQDDEGEKVANKLREKDRTVLKCIKEGRDDTNKITSSTDLKNHEVNYCFRQLEGLGLIKVETQKGMVKQYIDGQKRVFQAPNRGKLTRQGDQYFNGRG